MVFTKYNLYLEDKLNYMAYSQYYCSHIFKESSGGEVATDVSKLLDWFFLIWSGIYSGLLGVVLQLSI